MGDKEKIEMTDPSNPWSMPILKIAKEDNPTGLLCESSFVVKYPKYREKYLNEISPLLKKILKDFTIQVELDMMESTLEVKTTKATFDPFAIIKARDMIQLLARGVPLEQAQKVLDDEIFSEVVKIKGYTNNKKIFFKRRFRLIGKDKVNLKAMELLTKCYIHVHGGTVSIIGPSKGLQQARKIVVDTMNNVHPIYLLRLLHHKSLLMTDPNKANEDWTAQLPQIPKKNQNKRLKPHKIRQKKEYTPFPPAPPKSKIDLELEAGTYFANKQEQHAMKIWKKMGHQQVVGEERLKKRKQAFVPPPEPTYPPAKKAKTDDNSQASIQKLKKKVKRKMEQLEQD